jgi:hypothetical protein
MAMQQVEGRPLPVPRRRPGCRPAGVLGSRSQSLKGPQRSPEHHGGLCHTLDCDAITTVPCQVISIQVVVMVQLKLLNIIALFVSSGGCRCKTIRSLQPADVELGMAMQGDRLPPPAAAGPAKSMTPFEVMDCFIVLDQDRDGEVSNTEFIQGLKSNSLLAQKFGLEQTSALNDDSKQKYDLVFGQFDNDTSKSINVCSLSMFTRFLKTDTTCHPTRITDLGASQVLRT